MRILSKYTSNKWHGGTTGQQPGLRIKRYMTETEDSPHQNQQHRNWKSANNFKITLKFFVAI